VLARRSFRRLLIGQTASSLGDWLGTVALIALVLDLSGSSTAVGGVLVLRLAPSLVAGPAVARIVGRWNRRRTMLAMDAIRAGMVVLVPLVAALWWVYHWAFMLEAAGLVFLPARDAAIPELVGEDQLDSANGLVLASSYGMIPFGAALLGLAGLIAGGQAEFVIAFTVDAVTFVVSFVLIRPIRALDGGFAVSGGEHGFLRTFRLPLVRAFGPVTVIATLGLGALFSVGIVFVRDVLGASTADFAVLIALFGVGAACGLGILASFPHDSVRVVRYGLLAQGVVIAVMSLAPTVAVAFVGAAAFGAATCVTLTAAMSAVQELLADDERVLGFAAFHILIRVGLSLAAIGAGVAADLITGQRWWLVGELPPSRVVLLGAGLVVVAASAMIAPRLRRDRLLAAPGSAGVDVEPVTVDDESREERPAPVGFGGRVAGESLDEERHEDARPGERGAPAARAVEQGDQDGVGHQAADRGLADQSADREAAEERRRAGRGLDRECADGR
jgi:MFS family permease